MKYYVYAHYRLDNDELFYIGKGCNDRAWTKSGRNSYWQNIAAKYGYRVEVLQKNLENDEALELEKKLISEFDPKANFTNGGDGGDTFSKLNKDKLDKLKMDAKERAFDPNGGVQSAARLRKGKTKESDPGLKRMAESHSKKFSSSGNPMSGRSFWKEHDEDYCTNIKNKISKTLKDTYRRKPRKYKIVVCPYCEKSGAQGNMKRYHFDNCRKR